MQIDKCKAEKGEWGVLVLTKIRTLVIVEGYQRYDILQSEPYRHSFNSAIMKAGGLDGPNYDRVKRKSSLTKMNGTSSGAKTMNQNL